MTDRGSPSSSVVAEIRMVAEDAAGWYDFDASISILPHLDRHRGGPGTGLR